MDLKTQYIVLGTLQIGKYTFDKKLNLLINNATKQPVKPMLLANRFNYRIVLGYSHRIDVFVDEALYLLNFGVFNPNAKVIHRDKDPLNNNKENLTLSIEGNEIPNDTKQKIFDLFTRGKGYAEIGRTLQVNRGTVKQIIVSKFGKVNPHQFISNKKLVDSMRRDTYGYR